MEYKVNPLFLKEQFGSKPVYIFDTFMLHNEQKIHLLVWHRDLSIYMCEGDIHQGTNPYAFANVQLYVLSSRHIEEPRHNR